MKKSIALMLLILVSLSVSGCVEVKKTAVFRITGSATDAYGNKQVISYNDSVDLCAEVVYQDEQNKTQVKTACTRLISEQNGEFSFSVRADLTGKGEIMTIKQAMFYARYRVLGAQSASAVPVSVQNLQLTPDGGSVEINIPIAF